MNNNEQKVKTELERRGKRDGRKLTDAQIDKIDVFHRVSIGKATARLLARLERFHKREEHESDAAKRLYGCMEHSQERHEERS
jgi:hypothetical protein